MNFCENQSCSVVRVAKYCMGCIYTEKLFLVDLKFKFPRVSCILICQTQEPYLKYGIDTLLRFCIWIKIF